MTGAGSVSSRSDGGLGGVFASAPAQAAAVALVDSAAAAASSDFVMVGSAKEDQQQAAYGTFEHNSISCPM